MAFGSTNLVVTSTLLQEPDLSTDSFGTQPSHIKSYSEQMTVLNPRTPVLAPNLAPYTCTEYTLNAVSSLNNMVFKLASATYVKYVHAAGDGFDG